MRALAHPARIEIVEYLTDKGTDVTATECAGIVGLSPSATSYHLRELAKYGLVEQAPSRGDGRERVWRSTRAKLHIDPGPEDGPETRAAGEALVDVYLSRDLARAREWLLRQAEAPAEWRTAGVMMGHRLLVTSDELRDLNDRVNQLLEPYRMRERQHHAPEGARKVAVNYLAFPEP
jgi:DNA-binding transcriptional ArsR family regulator